MNAEHVIQEQPIMVMTAYVISDTMEIVISVRNVMKAVLLALDHKLTNVCYVLMLP